MMSKSSLFQGLTDKQTKQISDQEQAQGGHITQEQIEFILSGGPPIERGNPPQNKYSPYAGVRRGKAPDLPEATKSLYEANMWRVFRYHVKIGALLWVAYEPITLVFRVKFDAKTWRYTPDFIIVGPQGLQFVEVKGFFDDISKTKLRLFMKFYPEQARATKVITSSESKIRDARKLGFSDCELISGYAEKYRKLVNWQTKEQWDTERRLIKAEKNIDNPF